MAAFARASAIVADEKARKKSRARTLVAELRQMSRVSQREEGLLNHAQAAAVLEISTRRVGELVELGTLTRHDFLGRTYVSVREVLERREADVKAGRPLRSIAQRIRAAATVVGNYDPLNAAIDVVMPEPNKRKRKQK
jgi:hypothetical protein